MGSAQLGVLKDTLYLLQCAEGGTVKTEDGFHTLVMISYDFRAERLKAYAEKKSKKPALIAKTSVLFDVKPWDDETDMNEMLKNCKSIEKEGLVWGACELFLSVCLAMNITESLPRLSLHFEAKMFL